MGHRGSEPGRWRKRRPAEGGGASAARPRGPSPHDPGFRVEETLPEDPASPLSSRSAPSPSTLSSQRPGRAQRRSRHLRPPRQGAYSRQHPTCPAGRPPPRPRPAARPRRRAVQTRWRFCRAGGERPLSGSPPLGPKERLPRQADGNGTSGASLRRWTRRACSGFSPSYLANNTPFLGMLSGSLKALRAETAACFGRKVS